ncbi:MAG: hypothetical protein NTV31_17185 [Bacteroidia bacterium]|nr:hypothetical protein [Bacteroidia bacterium]
MNRKLRIGILVDNYLLPAWKYKIIEEITSSDFADISLVVRNLEGDSSPLRKNGHNSVVSSLHQKADRLIFGNKSDYNAIKNIGVLVKDIPEICAGTIVNGEFESFSQENLDEINKYNPDIILKLGFGLLAGEILKIPKYGVWSYTMDNYGTEKEGTSGYYEVVMGNPVTTSALEILKVEKEKNLVLSTAVEATCSYSIHLTRDRIFRRASLFTTRAIRGIYKYGNYYLEKTGKKFAEDISRKNYQFPVPSFINSVRNFSVALTILTQKIFKKIFYSDPFTWILLFKIDDKNDFQNNKYGDFKKLQPLKDKFWADPFIIKKGEHYYIFVEEFIYKKNKGHISVLELNNRGELLKVQTLIEKPYHMSYPSVFESEGVLYMIPETGGNRTIDLYKCVNFPGEWVFVKTIMSNLNAVDTTLFNYDGKWWLFTVIDEINSSLYGSPELFLFFTDDVLSDNWNSHPSNPVVSDIRIARPAGQLFIQDGKIYRPSQDCSERYGEAFNINQILTLTETEYQEIQVKKVKPDWDRSLKGTHTYNFDDDFTVIDVYSFRKRPFLFN